jgi:hypothetical protein
LPVSPTAHINPATAVPAPGAVDSNERRKRSDPSLPDDTDKDDGASPSPAHLIDREI